MPRPGRPPLEEDYLVRRAIPTTEARAMSPCSAPSCALPARAAALVLDLRAAS